jgi:hypothetical protein
MQDIYRIARNFIITAVVMAVGTALYADDGDDWDDAIGQKSVYGDMVAEVLVSPRSSALSSSDLAFNPAGPVVSNPALSARVEVPEITLSYSSYYGDVFSSSILSYVGQIGKGGGIGVTVAYLLIPGIEDTREVDIGALDSDDIRTFTASDIWARVSYGHSFVTKQAYLYAGAAATARRRNLDDESAYGLGVDLGAVAFFKKPSLYAGLLWENVRHGTVKWQSSDYSEQIPQHLRLSLAFEREDTYIYGRIALFYTTPDLLFNEGINYQDKVIDREEERSPEIKTLSDGLGILFSAGRYGVEYTIMNTLILRAGMNNSNYSLGAGLNLFKNRGSIDFSYINHELAGTVMMSATYRWQ